MSDDFGLGSGELGLLMGLGMVAIVFGLIVYVVVCFFYGKMFEKAGKPLWTGFVPIYNVIVWLEIIGRPWWWLLVLIAVGLVPVVGILAQIALAIILGIDTAKSFGKDTVHGVLFGLFSPIMAAVFAFSDSIQYVGPAAKDKKGLL